MKNFSTHSNLQSKKQENHPETKQVQEEKNQEEEEGGGERARCEWDLTLSTIVSSTTAVGAAADTIGAIEFDPSDTLLATGGIARKIRVYTLNSLLPHESSDNDRVALLDHNSACDYYICTPAKLGSLRWKPGSGGRVIGSGDYDGVVTEYDLETKVPVFERDEHGGQRVWSMDYSHWDPAVGASGSDDGTMQMWDPRCQSGKCVAAVRPSDSGSAVCCVEFNPFGGPLVAIGCADRKAYGYDVRNLRDPIMVLDGHSKTVTYVRFLDQHTLVTAGIDERLMLWDTQDCGLIRTYRGHVNSRRFVGLSVWRHGGLVGCGSESDQVFVYDKRWGEPIWVHGSEQVARAGGDGGGFVSGVCWSQVGGDRCTLVTGGSDGVLKMFEGKRLRPMWNMGWATSPTAGAGH